MASVGHDPERMQASKHALHCVSPQTRPSMLLLLASIHLS
ncbi:phosphatidylinositol transfer protein [Cystobacter fuscus DSM 2262]|uniref:Phosphatidylinositol transfer protein n=1 Tax=Cystobacter fuscus (strain ATCC 25194 / DSM 2262 / NBRC 100088 / M29) TaxID=1242864 RepID=S9P6K2_CYSF2|nr:phosphatidylinositol transfer protein [Cystobacter fuscus DSM 2262]